MWELNKKRDMNMLWKLYDKVKIVNVAKIVKYFKVYNICRLIIYIFEKKWYIKCWISVVFGI